LILNDHGEQLTVEMPGQLISNDIDVMADGIRNGLGIGRLFEPIWRLQPDRAIYTRDGELLENLSASVSLLPKNAGKTKRVKALIDFLIAATRR
jgi:DNA-binding transcriptional LysR family regulator